MTEMLLSTNDLQAQLAELHPRASAAHITTTRELGAIIDKYKATFETLAAEHARLLNLLRLSEPEAAACLDPNVHDKIHVPEHASFEHNGIVITYRPSDSPPSGIRSESPEDSAGSNTDHPRLAGLRPLNQPLYPTCGPTEVRDTRSRAPAGASSVAGQNRQHHVAESNTDSDVDGDEIHGGAEDGVKKPQESRTNRQISDCLVNKILSGQASMKGRRTTATDRSKIQSTLSQRQEKGPEKTLWELGKDFIEHRSEIYEDVSWDAWIDWYYAACCHRIYRLRREEPKDRKWNGAYLINLIVDILLVTDGPVALVVYGCLADRNHILKEASSRGDHLFEIAKLVAGGLHGKLESPPNWYQIPNAAIWISVIRGISFRDACHDLGIPNLAVLDLKPQWTIVERNGKQEEELSLGVNYTLVAGMWPSSERRKELGELRQLLQFFHVGELVELDGLLASQGWSDQQTLRDARQLFICYRLLQTDDLNQLRQELDPDKLSPLRWLQLHPLRQLLELRICYDESPAKARELLKSAQPSDLLRPVELRKLGKSPKKLKQLCLGKGFLQLCETSLVVVMLFLVAAVSPQMFELWRDGGQDFEMVDPCNQTGKGETASATNGRKRKHSAAEAPREGNSPTSPPDITVLDSIAVGNQHADSGDTYFPQTVPAALDMDWNLDWQADTVTDYFDGFAMEGTL